MTKLKNTKKGMAKKALSISLVAAMLATSNVPVWAAEDLFSDGSAAVEAPSAEVDTFSATPVEEVPTDAPALNANEITDVGLAVPNDLKQSDLATGNIEISSDVVSKLTTEKDWGDDTAGKNGETKQCIKLLWSINNTNKGETNIFNGDSNVVNIPSAVSSAAKIGDTITVKAQLITRTYSSTDSKWNRTEKDMDSQDLKVVYNNIKDYYTSKLNTSVTNINKGETLTYTGTVSGKNGATVLKTVWLDPEKHEVQANEEGLYYATKEGDYTLGFYIDTNTTTYSTQFVSVKTIHAGDLIDGSAITGNVSISNESDNQWGYKAKAEYSAQLPEKVKIQFIWQTQNDDGTWENVQVTGESTFITDEYLMKKTNCGKNLRVVAQFVNDDNGQIITSKESNSFEVAPLQIAADDISYDAEANFGLDKVNDNPEVNAVYVKKENVLDDQEKLEESEYELVTQDTDRPGIRTVTIKLKGAYAGERTETVNIGEYSLEDCKITLESSNVEFVGDGKYAEPVIKSVTWANRVELKEGDDYVIKMESDKTHQGLKDCINAGSYKLWIEGRGDFTGTYQYVDFNIVARSMENCKVVWTGKHVIKGEQLVAGVDVKDSENTHFVVVDEKGYVLIPDKDYTYDKDGYYDISEQKCKVIVNATGTEGETTGNYYGKAESDFVTVGTNLEQYVTEYVKSVVTAREYTGKEIKFDSTDGVKGLTKISAKDVAAVNHVNESEVGFSDDLEMGVDFDITYKNNVDAYLLKDANGDLLPIDKIIEYNGVRYYEQNQVDSRVENDDPQAPQVYLTFKGKYSGTTTPVRFTIKQKNIKTVEANTNKKIIFDPSATDANASSVYVDQIEAIKVKDDLGNILKDTVDYTYDYYYVNNTKDVSTEDGSFKLEMNAHSSKVMDGDTRVTVYDGNYYGTYTHEVSIDPKALTSDGITVASVPNQKYTGKLIEPKVTVTDGSYTLVEGTDYELKYKDNRSAGTATINIIGLDAKGRYTDTISTTFVIENKSIEDAKLLKKGVYVSSYTDLSKYKESDYVLTSGLYDNGREVTAEFDVVDANNNLLREGYDYTVTYKNNTQVGTATITITGKGDYEGTLVGSFEILGKGISGHFVEESIPAQTYTGEEIKPEVTFVPDTPNLVLGKDYEITYEYNVEPGKCEDPTDVDDKGPKVVARGIGQYAGSVKIGFEIKKADISVADVTAKDAVYAGGKVAEADITVINPASGKALIEGTDYSVEYISGKEVGDTGKAVLHLVNNKCYTFSGDSSDGATITVTYKIVAKDLKDVTIEAVKDQTYTGSQIQPTLTVVNGDVVMKEGVDYQVTYGENTEVGVGTAKITPVDGNKNYTGSKEISFNIVAEKPEVGMATISEVKVSGNTITPVLSGEVDGAVGYDYVLSTEEDYVNGRVQISKNVLATNTNFYYVEEGTYYVYCHAWKRDENGVKVFGNWSNIMKVDVTATTPETPTITKMEKSSNGKHLKITWTKSDDATGYDVVMGTAVRKVNGEYRPVDYGKAVKKITNGNTVSVIFYNIPKGTYYVGLHSYNRTSESGVKVFSKWSNVKAVTFK